MKVHMLKVWPQQFEELANGNKTFEFRKNDRDFRVGDTLYLQEYRPDDGVCTGRYTNRLVKHMLTEGFGLPEGYVVMSLAAYPSPQSNVVGIMLTKAEVEALLYGQPRHDFSEAMKKLASWLAEVAE